MTNPSYDDVLATAKAKTLDDARKVLTKKLEEKGLTKVYEEIELPLLTTIEKMQEYGVLVDVKYLEALSKEYHTELSKIEKKIYKEAGEEFNINSLDSWQIFFMKNLD